MGDVFCGIETTLFFIGPFYNWQRRQKSKRIYIYISSTARHISYYTALIALTRARRVNRNPKYDFAIRGRPSIIVQYKICRSRLRSI